MLYVRLFPASLLCLSAEFPAVSKLIKIRVSGSQGKESLCLLHLLDQLISLQEKHPGLKILLCNPLVLSMAMAVWSTLTSLTENF